MRRIRFMLFFLLYFPFPGPVSSQYELCFATNSSSYEITWPQTETKIASIPPCVGQSKEFLFRQCTDGVWAPEPECDYVQPTTQPQCPEDFIETANICYSYSPKSTFPPKCPYEDVLPFYSYIDEIYTKQPIWMPVQRDVNNGLGLLQWIEPSSLYKTDFNEDYIVLGQVKGKSCLLYHNTSYFEAVSCKEEHVGICAYNKFLDLSFSMCSNEFYTRCRRSDFPITSKCLCAGSLEDEPLYPLAEFLKPYQTFDAAETCNIGLRRNNKTGGGGFVWSKSQLEPNHTFWAQNETFDDNYSFVAITPDGWILTEDLVDHSVYEIETEILEASLTLEPWDGNLYSLEVNNSQWIKLQQNSDHLIYCFTNGYSNGSTYRQEPEKVGELLLITASDPGEYWCEGFRYPDLAKVMTNVVFHKPENFSLSNEFVAILRVPYPKEIDPLSKNMISFLQNELYSFLELESYDSRVMKIEYVDEENKTVLINVHVSPITFEDQYETTKSNIEKILTMTNIEMLELRNHEYCPTEKIDTVLWSQTNADQLVTPEEFCFKPDGTRAKRWCKRESFVDGAQWEHVGPCSVPERSQVTKNLLGIIEHQNSCESIKISQNYTKFNSLDIYLVGDVITTCFPEAIEDKQQIDSFADIYDGISKVNKTVLDKSEKEMRATTRLLLLFHSKESEVTSTVVKDSFIQARLFVKNLNGTALVKKGSTFEVQHITEEDLEKIIAIKNLESAIWLTPQLRTHVVSFTFFLSNALFVEGATSPKNIEKVFSVFFANSSSYDQKTQIWYVQRVSDESPRSCLSWKYANGRGYWQTDAEVEKINSTFVVCKFLPASEYHAIATNKLTESLQSLVECDTCSVSDTMENLLNYSKEHEKFSSTDVHLAAQILEKISGDANVNLTRLADVVSNLEQVKGSVLKQAQQDKGSTDKILQNIDEILKNHNYQSPLKITKGNFTIAITKLKDMDFGGLVVLSKQVQFLKGRFENYQEDDTFEAALHLNESLKAQIGKNSPIIMTVFKNNVLFRSTKSKFKIVGKIFGVVLPDIGNYSGPISIFHKVYSRKPIQCVYWSYIKSGSWVNDGQIYHNSNLVECQYLHATHFTNLMTPYFEEHVLDVITMINCSVSLLGLLVIVFTAIVFKAWRTKPGNQILLNFSAAMILQIIVFFIASCTFEDPKLCKVIGAVLHYSVIAEFCWMLVIAYLQYKRFVEVLGAPPEKILWKACICGWVLPTIPVIVVISCEEYKSEFKFCYPSGSSLRFGVWLPVSVIVCINFLIFSYIMYMVVNSKTPRRHGKVAESIFHWRLGILLFFMLGLTWIFGFLSNVQEKVFMYLFCITATLQGFVVFLFFIVLNVETRNLYRSRTVVYYVK